MGLDGWLSYGLLKAHSVLINPISDPSVDSVDSSESDCSVLAGFLYLSEAVCWCAKI